MIGYWPMAYEDELIYSYLARTMVANGINTYRYFADEIFKQKTDAPNMLYVNGLKEDVLEHVMKAYGCSSFSELIGKATMLPYYSRFFNDDKKRDAFQKLMKGQVVNDILRRSTKNSISHLRYCPICVKENREQLGETYWHRSHQMDGIRCCARHGLGLRDSSVMCSGKASPSFQAAEIEIDDIEATEPVPSMELELAQYHQKMLYLPMAEDATPLVVIKKALVDKGYVSVRGGAIHVTDIAKDMEDFYRDVPQECLLTWQIQKLLSGCRQHPKDICALAYFLQIVPTDLLAHSTYEIEKQSTNFDKRCRTLLENGICINEAARKLGVSSKTVRDVRDGLLTNVKKSVRGKGGCKPKDWVMLDEATLPKVRRYIKRIQSAEAAGARPHKITAYGCAVSLALEPRSLYRMERCRELLHQYQETKEEYWAREIIWMVSKYKREGQTICYTDLRRELNLRRSYIEAAVPYIKDNEIKEIVKEL